MKRFCIRSTKSTSQEIDETKEIQRLVKVIVKAFRHAGVVSRAGFTLIPTPGTVLEQTYDSPSWRSIKLPEFEKIHTEVEVF